MPLSPDARVTAIRKGLESVRGSMLQASADAIEQSIPRLAEAAEALASVAEEISSRPPTPGRERERLMGEVCRLKADLAHLAALAMRGLEFCRRWSQKIQSSAGYLPNGQAAPTQSSMTILLRG
jgi:hypothetical protein